MKTIVVRGIRVRIPNHFVTHRSGVMFICGVMHIKNDMHPDARTRPGIGHKPFNQSFVTPQKAVRHLMTVLGESSSLEDAFHYLVTGKTKGTVSSKEKPAPRWRKATKEECAQYNRKEGQLFRRCIGFINEQIRETTRLKRKKHLRLMHHTAAVRREQLALTQEAETLKKKVADLRATIRISPKVN